MQNPIHCLVAGLLFGSLGLPSLAVAAGFPIDEVAPGVFIHVGQQVDTEHPARGDIANLGFVIGERCVAVIDSGGSYATGSALRAAIAARTARPICFVINTHGHFDHVLGNAAFLADAPEFIGHAALPEAMGASLDFFRSRFGPELAGAPEPNVVLPTATVAATRELDLGGRSLRLTAHPVAHSAADLTVEDSASRTLWTGDLLFRARLPVLDGSLRGWQAWMDAAAGQGYPLVIPGHGEPARDWPAPLAPQREYLAALARTVRAAIDAGTFLEDLTTGGDKGVPAGWLLTQPHTRNLGRAWLELEWE